MKFGILSALLFVAFTVASCQELASEDADCKNCDLAKCPLPGKCFAGTVRDKCGCCEICGLEEGQICNYSPTKDGNFWHGFCGAGMECRKKKDIDASKVKYQNTCACDKTELVCGTDEVTYTTCQMSAMSKKTNGQISKKYEGPCLTRPRIVSSSESQTVKEGDKHSLLCEVQGFPIPSIEWLFTPTGLFEKQVLPGDSAEISIVVRGGPEKMRVTGYLQITDFQLKHEGNYECIAHGNDGIASKTISLLYTRKPKHDL